MYRRRRGYRTRVYRGRRSTRRGFRSRYRSRSRRAMPRRIGYRY